MLDGTTSAHDWVDDGRINSQLKDLARAMNPKKGYIVACNNRFAGDNSLYDHGAFGSGTARTLRITELIEAKIEAGEKMTIEDMKAF